MACIPRSPQSTLSNDIKRAVRSPNKRVVDISTIMIYECSVCAFPGSDAAAAVAEGEERGLDPQGTEAVEEVCLSGYGAVVDVCVS